MLDTTKTDGNQWNKNVFGWQQFHLIKRNLVKQ